MSPRAPVWGEAHLRDSQDLRRPLQPGAHSSVVGQRRAQVPTLTEGRQHPHDADSRWAASSICSELDSDYGQRWQFPNGAARGKRRERCLCPFANQMLERGSDRWPASFGLPAPEQAKALTVPSDEGPGLHDNQSISPIEPAAEQHRRQAGRIVGASGLDLALLIEQEMLAPEQILGRDGSSGPQAQTQKVDWITQYPQPTQPCAHDAGDPPALDAVSSTPPRTMRGSSPSEMFLRSTPTIGGVWPLPFFGLGGFIPQLAMFRSDGRQNPARPTRIASRADATLEEDSEK